MLPSPSSPPSGSGESVNALAGESFLWLLQVWRSEAGEWNWTLPFPSSPVFKHKFSETWQVTESALELQSRRIMQLNFTSLQHGGFRWTPWIHFYSSGTRWPLFKPAPVLRLWRRLSREWLGGLANGARFVRQMDRGQTLRRSFSAGGGVVSHPTGQQSFRDEPTLTNYFLQEEGWPRNIWEDEQKLWGAKQEVPYGEITTRY